MSLDELTDDVTDEYAGVDEETTVALDRQSRNELAMLLAAFDADTEELLRRGVHALFRSTVDTGDLDFHLRRQYDVTYDEYLSGVTYDEVGDTYDRDDDRRYQM
ncbi:MAG: hypothetical protein ABEI75_03655 [Halobaculum sp.]